MFFPDYLGISIPNSKKNIGANDNKGRDYICSAEGASNSRESLRQKNSCLTQLWRVLHTKGSHQRGQPVTVNFQVPGQRPLVTTTGGFCPFFVPFRPDNLLVFFVVKVMTA
jgi:hypothetical protein